MTSPDGPGADTAETMKALRDNAKRYGLTWDRTMATVIDGSNPASVTVAFDSDEGAATVGVISMVGVLVPGDRVYVDQVPPAGNYVVGVANPVPRPVGFVATATGTGFLSTETIILSIPSVSFPPGHAYKIEYEADMDSVSANSFVSFTTYRDSGVKLRTSGGTPTPLVGFAVTCKGAAIVRNLRGVTYSTVIAVSVTPFVSNCRLNAAANRLAWCRVTEIGPASKYPLATTI